MKNWNNSDELAKECQEDLKELRAIYERLKSNRSDCIQMKKECEERGDWEAAATYKVKAQELKLQMQEIGPIISSSQFSIQWLKRGHEPKSGNPVSKLNYTQRTVTISDTDQVLNYMNTIKHDFKEMDQEQLFDMRQRMHKLTNREYDVYVSIKGKGNTFEETAEYMAISKSSVQEYFKRAENKLEMMLEESFQATLF